MTTNVLIAPDSLSVDATTNRDGSTAHIAEKIADDLLRASQGDAAYHLSGALHTLIGTSEKSGLGPLSAQRCAELLDALAGAENAVLSVFSKQDQAHARLSLRAFRNVIEWWAAIAPGMTPPKIEYERKLRLRWLQNACFNASLLDELASRAKQRRATILRDLRKIGFANG